MKPVAILVPPLGESISEALVAEWLKKPGDAVALDEPLVTLETDKVTLEIPSPAAGVLQAISVREGASVSIGASLGTITPDKSAKPPTAPQQETPQQETPPPAPAKPAPVSPPVLSPAARKHAGDAGIDPASLRGSGKDGRIMQHDVPSALAVRPLPQGSGEERVKMSPLRRTIARRLRRAVEESVMLTTFNEADMSALIEARRTHQQAFSERHGVRLGFMSFFVKACAAALYDVPEVNAEISGDDIIYRQFAHIGVAVGTERGLIVPVLRHAEALSLADIERQIGQFAAAARTGKITMADLQGGTFTISNGGVYGSLMSTPILNPPQAGILGMHKIDDRPVVRNGAVVVRPMMYLALTYDHRLVDGQQAVSFLVQVKSYIEEPVRLLLDL